MGSSDVETGRLVQDWLARKALSMTLRVSRTEFKVLGIKPQPQEDAAEGPHLEEVIAAGLAALKRAAPREEEKENAAVNSAKAAKKREKKPVAERAPPPADPVLSLRDRLRQKLGAKPEQQLVVEEEDIEEEDEDEERDVDEEEEDEESDGVDMVDEVVDLASAVQELKVERAPVGPADDAAVIEFDEEEEDEDEEDDEGDAMFGDERAEAEQTSRRLSQSALLASKISAKLRGEVVEEEEAEHVDEEEEEVHVEEELVVREPTRAELLSSRLASKLGRPVKARPVAAAPPPKRKPAAAAPPPAVLDAFSDEEEDDFIPIAEATAPTALADKLSAKLAPMRRTAAGSSKAPWAYPSPKASRTAAPSPRTASAQITRWIDRLPRRRPGAHAAARMTNGRFSAAVVPASSPLRTSVICRLRDAVLLEGHRDAVLDVAFTPSPSPCVTKAWTASMDDTFRAWDMDSRTGDVECHAVNTSEHMTAASRYSDNLGRVVTVTVDGAVSLVNATTCDADFVFDRIEAGSVRALAVARHAGVFAVGTKTAVVIYDASQTHTVDRARVLRASPVRSAVVSLAVGASGEHVFYATRKRVACIRLGSGAPTFVFKVDVDGVSALVATDDGAHLLGSTADGAVHVWDADTGDEMAVLDSHRAVADADGNVMRTKFDVTPCGKYVAVPSGSSELAVYDTSSGRRLAMLKSTATSAPATCVSFNRATDSPSPLLSDIVLATGHADGSVAVWTADGVWIR